MKRVLVTGGAGFIGSHLVQALLQTGAEVAVVDRGGLGQLRPLPRPADGYQIDLNKTDQLAKIIAEHQPEIIYHLAGHTQLRVAEKQPQMDSQQNVGATLSLVEACLSLPASRQLPTQLIFASSSAVYGGVLTPPFAEDTVPQPVNPYGIAKLAAEQYLNWFGRLTGVKVTNLRYANVYGPGQSVQGEAGVVAKFITLAQAGQPLPIYGDGQQSRDFIYVSDVVAANLAAAATGLAGTYVIGTGRPTTAREVATACSKLAAAGPSARRQQRKAPSAPAAMQLEFVAAPASEQIHSTLNASRFRQLTGWQPQIEFATGLRRTWEWWLDQQERDADTKA